MENRWSPEEQKEKIIQIIWEFMEKRNKDPRSEKGIDFYNYGISPSQFKEILENDLRFEKVHFGNEGEWVFVFL